MRRKGRRRRERKRQRRWRKKGARGRRGVGGRNSKLEKFNGWFLLKAVDRMNKTRAVVHRLGEQLQMPQSGKGYVLHSTVIHKASSLTSEYYQEI